MIQQRDPTAPLLWLVLPLMLLTVLLEPSPWGIEAVLVHVARVAMVGVLAVHAWRTPDPALRPVALALVQWVMVLLCVAVVVFGSVALYHLWQADRFRQLLGS